MHWQIVCGVTGKRSVTITATQRKVSFFHIRMKAHSAKPRSSNSKLYKVWGLAQPTKPDRLRGSILVKRID